LKEEGGNSSKGKGVPVSRREGTYRLLIVSYQTEGKGPEGVLLVIKLFVDGGRRRKPFEDQLVEGSLDKKGGYAGPQIGMCVWGEKVESWNQGE